jgi:hypothetical protein
MVIDKAGCPPRDRRFSHGPGHGRDETDGVAIGKLSTEAEHISGERITLGAPPSALTGCTPAIRLPGVWPRGNFPDWV